MESEIYGYCGRLLRVNLSKNIITIEKLEESFCREYIGGAGFVTHFLLKEMLPNTDAYSSDNKIVFATGPLTGTILPGTDRFCVGAKSPMTNTIAKAESGGVWGVVLKRAGFDVVIIEGKSEKPVYLWIHDGQAEIRDAEKLWGMTTKDTQDAIRTQLGDNRIRVAMIGPGGENLVRYASVMVGGHDAAGRGGIGAVMGSKNLKAIAVKGKKAPEIHDPEGLKKIRQWLLSNIEMVKALQLWGTTGGMVAYEANGNLPVRNYRDGLFPGVKKIDSAAIKSTFGMKMDGCFACPVRCKKIVKMDKPYSLEPEYGAPEYESLASLGSNCGVDDLPALLKANELCNAYSIDTISIGNTIAFAMECFEKGLISKEDTGGIDLVFGNHDAMLQVIELIAEKKGFGELLAEGVSYAAKKIGHDTHEYAIHVKGLEPGEHEPRLKPMVGLGYMVAFNGADHCMGVHDDALGGPVYQKDLSLLGMSGAFSVEDTGSKKVEAFRVLHNKRILGDSLPFCHFMPYSLEQLADAVKAVTGWDITIFEQQRVADRIETVGRAFMVREGFDEKDDVLPKRFFKPKTDGALSDTALTFEEMERAKRYYYQLMGWDDKGVPLPQRLEELGILAE